MYTGYARQQGEKLAKRILEKQKQDAAKRDCDDNDQGSRPPRPHSNGDSVSLTSCNTTQSKRRPSLFNFRKSASSTEKECSAHVMPMSFDPRDITGFFPEQGASILTRSHLEAKRLECAATLDAAQRDVQCTNLSLIRQAGVAEEYLELYEQAIGSFPTLQELQQQRTTLVTQLQGLTFRERSLMVPKLEALDAHIQREEEASRELSGRARGSSSEGQVTPHEHDHREDSEPQPCTQYQSHGTLQYKDQVRPFAVQVRPFAVNFPVADAVAVIDSLIAADGTAAPLLSTGDPVQPVGNNTRTVTRELAQPAVNSPAVIGDHVQTVVSNCRAVTDQDNDRPGSVIVERIVAVSSQGDERAHSSSVFSFPSSQGISPECQES